MRFKLFEEYNQDGYIKVPSDFEDKLKGLKDITKRKRELYNIIENQMKIDLLYGIKWEIREFLDAVEKDTERTQENYERFLNNEIYSERKNGILFKYSGGKYFNIDPEDVEEVKSILWKYINETIPYDEVNYTYKLDKKLISLLDKFIEEIKEKELFKVED